MKKINFKRKKKGVSVMIGYVLLIATATVLGIIVYQWLTTYVPRESSSCPDDVSVFIKEKECSDGWLNFTIKNNGRFSIGGYFVYISTDEEDDFATIDISDYSQKTSSTGKSLVFDPGKNSLDPNEEVSAAFYLTGSGYSNIYLVGIIPARFQEEDNKLNFVSCGDATIMESLSSCTIS